MKAIKVTIVAILVIATIACSAYAVSDYKRKTELISNVIFHEGIFTELPAGNWYKNGTVHHRIGYEGGCIDFYTTQYTTIQLDKTIEVYEH